VEREEGKTRNDCRYQIKDVFNARVIPLLKGHEDLFKASLNVVFGDQTNRQAPLEGHWGRPPACAYHTRAKRFFKIKNTLSLLDIKKKATIKGKKGS
jgi:hypothetical protein